MRKQLAVPHKNTALPHQPDGRAYAWARAEVAREIWSISSLKISLFSELNSLFLKTNSLFFCVGNFAENHLIRSRVSNQNPTNRPDLTKFPDNFPVSRECGSGDGFDCDCVRHHAVHSVIKVSDQGAKASNLRAFAGLRAARCGLCQSERPHGAVLGLLSLRFGKPFLARCGIRGPFPGRLRSVLGR